MNYFENGAMDLKHIIISVKVTRENASISISSIHDGALATDSWTPSSNDLVAAKYNYFKINKQQENN